MLSATDFWEKESQLKLVAEFHSWKREIFLFIYIRLLNQLNQ